MEIEKTRTGKVIEYKPHQAIDEFSEEFNSLSDSDRFDVYCMYQWLIVRAISKKQYSPGDYDWWESRLNKVDELTGSKSIGREMSEANMRTSYEMVQFGKKMVTNFWREY